METETPRANIQVEIFRSQLRQAYDTAREALADLGMGYPEIDLVLFSVAKAVITE